MSNALDGEIRDGRHHQAVRVYYEDTDFSRFAVALSRASSSP